MQTPRPRKPLPLPLPPPGRDSPTRGTRVRATACQKPAQEPRPAVRAPAAWPLLRTAAPGPGSPLSGWGGFLLRARSRTCPVGAGQTPPRAGAGSSTGRTVTGCVPGALGGPLAEIGPCAGWAAAARACLGVRAPPASRTQEEGTPEGQSLYLVHSGSPRKVAGATGWGGARHPRPLEEGSPG